MQEYFEHSVIQDSVMRQRTINRFYNILNGPPPKGKSNRTPKVDPFLSQLIDETTLSAMVDIAQGP